MEKQQSGFTLIELMIVVAIIAILAAIAISQYSDYLIRTQVSEGAALADGAKTAVAEYYNSYGRFGTTNASVGLSVKTQIKGKYVTDVDAGGGKITASFGGGETNALLQGKQLVFSPITHEGSIEWVCNPAGGLPTKYVPSVCRN